MLHSAFTGDRQARSVTGSAFHFDGPQASDPSAMLGEEHLQICQLFGQGRSNSCWLGCCGIFSEHMVRTDDCTLLTCSALLLLTAGSVVTALVFVLSSIANAMMQVGMATILASSGHHVLGSVCYWT